MTLNEQRSSDKVIGELRLTRPLFLVPFVVALAAFSLACANSRVAEDLSNGAPKVLVISSDHPHGAPLGIKGMLEEHKIPVTFLTAGQATPERAREFDLIILAGRDLPTSRIAESNRPILGYGSYGYVFLGTLRLKNGSPFA